MKNPTLKQNKIIWWVNVPAMVFIFLAMFIVWAWNVPVMIYFKRSPSFIFSSLIEILQEMYYEYFEYP